MGMWLYAKQLEYGRFIWLAAKTVERPVRLAELITKSVFVNELAKARLGGGRRRADLRVRMCCASDRCTRPSSGAGRNSVIVPSQDLASHGDARQNLF
jgi:hypothetical protein